MKEIDVVLSGSGVRLGCHYGALLALQEDFIIKRIIGTSGGAIIASAYKCYDKFNSLYDTLINVNFNKLMCDGKSSSWIRLIKSNGLYKGNRFEKYINNTITNGRKLNAVDELYIVATDLTLNKPIILNKWHGYGNLDISRAVRLSMSAPYYWVPKTLEVNKEKHLIVDGGIAANYYIDFFDDNIRPTIGISLYTKEKKQLPKIFGYYKSILDTMMICNEREHIDEAHWSKTIKIDTGNITPFDLDIKHQQIEWLISHAYCETKKSISAKLLKI